MAKKALIVGVSNYAPIALNLESSVFEMRQWRDLLVEKYAFAEANIRILENCRARKEIIMDRLEWLLAQARAGDQLVYIFCGHGLRGRRRDSSGKLRDHEDEALVAFPGGARDPLDVAIFDDELTALYDRMAVPDGALPTFILNCCYSGGIDFAEHPMLQQSVAPQVAATSVVRFGLQLAETSTPVRPAIVAASSGTSVAIEVERDKRARSLFSMLVLDALGADPTLTYSQLVDTITPMMRDASQKPCFRGDPQREQKQFLH